MSDFARQQSDFQRGILTGDDSVLVEILDSPREKRDVLFGVYKHAYGSRLVEAMRFIDTRQSLPSSSPV